jgi:Flp pilus assembly protein TadD
LGKTGAIADFTEAIEINPEDQDCHNDRGLAKIRLGENEAGCVDFSKAVKLGSEKAHIFINKYCK